MTLKLKFFAFQI